MLFKGFLEYTSASIRKINENTTVAWHVEEKKKQQTGFKQVAVLGKNAFA